MLQQFPHPLNAARLPGLLGQVHVRRIQRAAQLDLRRLKLFVEGPNLVSLPLGIYRIRQGNVRGHAAAMKGLFIGGLVIAGIFTLIPGRILGNLLWRTVLAYGG